VGARPCPTRGQPRLAPAMAQRPPPQRPEIPGYYYDAERNRYFRVMRSNTAADHPYRADSAAVRPPTRPSVRGRSEPPAPRGINHSHAPLCRWIGTATGRRDRQAAGPAKPGRVYSPGVGPACWQPAGPVGAAVRRRFSGRRATTRLGARGRDGACARPVTRRPRSRDRAVHHAVTGALNASRPLGCSAVGDDCVLRLLFGGVVDV